jgi:hypothetical protein
MGGRAQQGSDYTLTGTADRVTIPAGQTAATVLLHSITDHVNEKNETATMILANGTGYKVPKRTKATVTITNAP